MEGKIRYLLVLSFVELNRCIRVIQNLLFKAFRTSMMVLRMQIER
jgi:hypothetical protein